MKSYMFRLFLPIVFIIFSSLSFASEKDTKFNDYADKLRHKLASQYTPDLKDVPNIIVAEQSTNNIVMLNPNKSWNCPDAEVWRWNPFKANGMPVEYAKWFRFIDECKPIIDTSHIIVTASHGGVAIIRMSDKKVLFFAHAGQNPHSACLLPDGNVVAVSSTDNKLTLFDTSNYKQGQPCRNFTCYELEFAHGIVWDNDQQILWGLGMQSIVGYKYNFNKKAPALTKAFTYEVPEMAKRGHDLYPVPNTKYLFATGTLGAVLFDTQTRHFRDISQVKHIKSISMADNGQVIYLKATKRWWSDSVVAGNGQLTKIGTCPNSKIYKARWFLPNEFSACKVLPKEN